MNKVMEKMEQLAKEEAVNTILSDLGGLDPDDILEALDNGTIPDEISVWEPYEYYEPAQLLEAYDEHYDSALRLIKQAQKINKRRK